MFTCSITFIITRTCAPNYYDINHKECGMYCKDSETYICNKNGFKICKDGYINYS